jgi:glyoxylase-like metal-dependent hydrolase (beta-lactamase superfamily II)
MSIPHLHMIQSRAVNVYLLEHDSGLTVIDAGLPGSLKRILATIQQIGHQPNDVKQILVTHTDIDHVGGLGALVKATGAEVVASAEAVPFLRKHTSPPHVNLPTVLPIKLIDKFIRQAVNVDQVVKDGDVLVGGIQVIITPGHTADHVSYFWEPGRVLFAGDLFFNRGKMSLTPKRITYSQTAASESAQKVLVLRPTVICPGHGPIWMGDSDDLKDLI